MTERRASRTAVLVCQGRAVAHGRIAPDRFADPTAMPLLREAERAQVSRVRDEQPPNGMAERMQYEMIRAGSEIIVPRTVAIDDAVRAVPTPQVVILGAGLDGRAWRLDLPGTVVFEVDHPASQQEKRERAAVLEGEPPRYVPVDFARDRLTDALKAAGHRDDEPTTWIWEGVVPYLTRPEVAATVAAVTARSAPGSRLIVNYQAPSLLGGVARKLIGAAARRFNPWAAEPWRSTWTPAAMSRLLATHAFVVRRDHDLLETATALGVRPERATSLRNGRIALADH
ncbi:class I SAM-dependent methyltransferase [Paractinoplanes toevensis]|uniref:S-adenosyl-L-methionine-dependent methyltransferase n=1 Tax=Paractinoplanes toevensis TaxID=571911 RepID=A0A919TBN2_9ACTN|nr:class I SAM-dependent methyltransferase [Actinoplanes toevensis]GIM91786.1 S-adenosyl-L-methionine-dependent methyltransferase [Actinoplanes toevensis]